MTISVQSTDKVRHTNSKARISAISSTMLIQRGGLTSVKPRVDTHLRSLPTGLVVTKRIGHCHPGTEARWRDNAIVDHLFMDPPSTDWSLEPRGGYRPPSPSETWPPQRFVPIKRSLQKHRFSLTWSQPIFSRTSDLGIKTASTKRHLRIPKPSDKRRWSLNWWQSRWDCSKKGKLHIDCCQTSPAGSKNYPLTWCTIRRWHCPIMVATRATFSSGTELTTFKRIILYYIMI